MNLKFVSVCIVALLQGKSRAATLRGGILGQETKADTISRRLEISDFVPLECNANLNLAPCASWTSKFGNRGTYEERIVIPCGECVRMDYSGGILTLNGGLDIQGKLEFPDSGPAIEVVSTMIAVQGELKITSTKPVDGQPMVKVTMIGQEVLSFTPIGNNANKCGGVSCDAGKKSIVVAGGKVDLNGLPADTPTWVNLYDVAGGTNFMPSSIIVKDSVTKAWTKGAEVLITSHTRVWNEHQQRTIVQVKNAAEAGFVEILLDKPIILPTTIKESPDFAVEVALLSRNIVFQGGADSNPIHGGHFMIMHTPNVVQSIVGVDVRNFGQQGSLGRYPIHFHLCGDVFGSKVAKNTIRQSNQRCIVVHGTNRLLIEENVAYDTLGHCFMTEDGIEVNNTFIRNLGAQTGIPSKILVKDAVIETDGEPATFWMAHPSNYLIDNVAAGSRSAGFWIEPVKRGERAYLYPDMNPSYEPLGAFDGNVAHSNGDPDDNVQEVAAVRTYASSRFHEPLEKAIYKRMRVYRNNNKGFMFHKNRNYVVQDSLFADNNIGVDLDRTDGAIMRRVAIIGVSASYRRLMERQTVQRICNENNRQLVGLDMHTWTLYNQEGGGFLEDIVLSGFDDIGSGCTQSSIHVDLHNVEENQFEFYSAFRNINLREGSASINFCDADRLGITMAHFVDLDGSLRPPGVEPKGASTLIGTSTELSRFVDPSKCTAIGSKCYSYCADTCFRSIRYETPGTTMNGFVLKACKASDSSSCSTFQASRRGPTDPRSFVAHLPVGDSYNLYFLSGLGEKKDPPSGGVFRYDFSVCPPESGDFSVTYDGKPIPNLEPARTLPAEAFPPRDETGPVDGNPNEETGPVGGNPNEETGPVGSTPPANFFSFFFSFISWLLSLFGLK